MNEMRKFHDELVEFLAGWGGYGIELANSYEEMAEGLYAFFEGHSDELVFRRYPGAAATTIKRLEQENLELRAQVLEYEHALEHISEDPSHYEHCVALAKSALERRNKEDFLEIARG